LRTANALLIDEDNLRFAIADYWQDHDEFIAIPASVADGVCHVGVCGASEAERGEVGDVVVGG
jgi:hypothetical protein